MQLTIPTFPKHKPNITLEQVEQFMRCPVVDYEPSNKEIRLAIDLAVLQAPMKVDLHDTVRSILQCDISNERIDAVKPFKKITHKRVIVCDNGKHKIVKVLRKRNFK